MVLLKLIGAVFLLLWGMGMVRTGVLEAYGGNLRRATGAGTRNRFSAFLIGLGVTLVLQSSTATALLTASFAGGGLVAVAPALAIMLGADVGTSLVAQVLSFDLSWLSPLLIIAGVLGYATGGTTRRRDLGRAAVGLGVMILSLGLIAAALGPVRESRALLDIISALGDATLIALIIAALLAWAAHSSLAVVLLVVSFASLQGLPTSLLFALVLGANLGGTLPAVVATLGDGREARRVPLGNLVFKLAGCVVVLPLLDQIAPLVAMLEGDAARQVVNFHAAFNLAIAAVFLFATGPVARLCVRLLPEEPEVENGGRPRYLDPSVTRNPSAALACAARETLRMGDTVETMLRRTIEVFRTDDRAMVAEIQDMDDTLDDLHRAIKFYLTEISRGPMSEADSHRCSDILAFTINLEHIGDIIDKNLMELAAKKIRHGLRFSDEGMREISDMHHRLLDNLSLALGVFISDNTGMARQLITEKEHFRQLERRAAENHFERLRAGKLESIETSALHLDILRDLKRINSHMTSVAYPILETAGELRGSRLKSPVAAGPAETPAGDLVLEPEERGVASAGRKR